MLFNNSDFRCNDMLHSKTPIQPMRGDEFLGYPELPMMADDRQLYPGMCCPTPADSCSPCPPSPIVECPIQKCVTRDICHDVQHGS